MPLLPAPYKRNGNGNDRVFPLTLTGGKEKNVCVPCLIHAVRGKARVGGGGKGGGVGLMARDAKGEREERREMASLAASSLLEKGNATKLLYYESQLPLGSINLRGGRGWKKRREGLRQ